MTTTYSNLRIRYASVYDTVTTVPIIARDAARPTYMVGFEQSENPEAELPWKSRRREPYDLHAVFKSAFKPLVTFSEYSNLVEAFQIAELRNIRRDLLLRGAICDVHTDDTGQLLELFVYRHTIVSSRQYQPVWSKP